MVWAKKEIRNPDPEYAGGLFGKFLYFCHPGIWLTSLPQIKKKGDFTEYIPKCCVPVADQLTSAD